jgi:DNA primase large subunit
LNFFGHFFLDGDNQRPWHSLGLVYPDLYRDLFKQNLPDSNFLRNTKAKNIANFSEGIQKHLSRDKEFHSNAMFSKNYEAIKSIYIKENLHTLLPRYWFGIHVFMELMIDRIIVRENPEAVSIFYQHMQEVLAHSSQKDEIFENDHHHSFFLKRLERIYHDKYIFAYTNNEMFIRAFWGVYNRVGIKVEEKLKLEISTLLEDITQKIELTKSIDWKSLKK